MRSTTYLLLFLVMACSPGPSSTERAAVVVEIAALDTPEKRTAYLDDFGWPAGRQECNLTRTK